MKTNRLLASLAVLCTSLLPCFAKDPMILDLQKKLASAGFDPKGIDGNWGPGTKAALKAYEAKKGDAAEAEYNLGVQYCFGVGVKQDIQAALTSWQKALVHGSAAAMCNLGVCQLNGIGVAQNEAGGAEMIAAAAEKDDPVAEWILGDLYKNGRGVRQDEQKAMDWLRRAAGHGEPAAQYRLGALMWQAADDSDSKDKACQLIAKAAAQGCIEAQLAKVNLESGLAPACFVVINLDPGPEGTRQFLELQKKNDPAWRAFEERRSHLREQLQAREEQERFGMDKKAWAAYIEEVVESSMKHYCPRFRPGGTDEALLPFKITLIADGQVILGPEDAGEGEMIMGPWKIAPNSPGKFDEIAKVAMRLERKGELITGIVEGHVTCTAEGQVHVKIMPLVGPKERMLLQGFHVHGTPPPAPDRTPESAPLPSAPLLP